MFNKILIVCIGNICRSPTAETILQSLLPTIEVSSAGVNALVGCGINGSAEHILKRNGFEQINHTARQITQALITETDLVLVMDKQQLQHLSSKYPCASGKVMLLGKWSNNEEIPDPYQKTEQAFINAFEQIEQNCKIWAEKLA